MTPTGQTADGTREIGVRRSIPLPTATAWEALRTALLADPDWARTVTVQSEQVTRFAIDAATAIRLAEDDRPVPDETSLVAPAVLKSQSLDVLFRDVQSGRRSERDALELVRRIVVMRIRLLSDRVSQRTAWRIAAQLGQNEIGEAEYLAVAQLQADALVAGSASLARAAEHIVPLAPYDSIYR